MTETKIETLFKVEAISNSPLQMLQQEVFVYILVTYFYFFIDNYFLRIELLYVCVLNSVINKLYQINYHAENLTIHCF